MLLLFLRGPVVAATIALSAPAPAVTVGLVALDAAAETITLTAPDAPIKLGHIVIAAPVTLTAPSATLIPGGVAVAASASAFDVAAPETTLNRALPATSAAFAVTAPTAAAQYIHQPPAQIVALTAPAATVAASGVIRPAPASGFTMTTGAAGLALDVTVAITQIAGVGRLDVRRSTLSITDVLDEAPNTCTFTVDGAAPVENDEVIIALGIPSNVIFAGRITTIEQVREGGTAIAWHCSAIDYTRDLDSLLVHEHFPQQSATTTVLALLATYAPGFVASHVSSGLPTIEAIDFTWEAMSRALTRIAKLIGGYWYVDYSRGLHFFLSETTDMPDPITDAVGTVRPDLERTVDVTQLRTRVIVEGGGSNAATAVDPGATQLPVEDPVWYSSSGGLLKIGTQRVSYSGKISGGVGSIVRGMDAPTATPSATLNGTAGNVSGTVRYKVSFKGAGGETLPGPASASVTAFAYGESVGGSGPAPTAGAVSGVGRLVGSYRYRMTLVTALGETPFLSWLPASALVSATAVAAPSAPSISATATLGVLVGTYNYKVSFVTALGETLPGAAGSRTATAFASPGAPSGAQPSNTIGNLVAGAQYRWKVGFVTELGETLPGSASSALTIATITTPGAPTGHTATAGGNIPPSGFANYRWAVVFVAADGTTSAVSSGYPSGAVQIVAPNQTINLTGIATGPTGTVARRIYRADGGGAYKFVGEIPDNLATTFTDDVAVAGAAAPTTGTVGGKATVTLPSAPTEVLLRRVYRTKANGSTYYLVSEVEAGTTFNDNVLDDGLTVVAPVLATAGGQQHTVTLPTGPGGTLARRIYRTAAGGTEYRLLAEVQDNTTTSFLDNTRDAGGQGPLLVATAGGQNIVVSLPSSAPMTATTARRLYRTKDGGSEYFFVGQVNGDTAGATFLDSKLDTELGAPPPTVNTAGADAVRVTIPIGGSGITARRLYRLDSAGNYRFALEVPNNSATFTVDTLSEADLGDVAPTTSTIGALAGETTLRLDSTSGFPSAGWFYSGSQLVRYTGVSGSTLTGIPTSGAGAIVTPLRVGTEIITASMLTGIPSSGTGAIVTAITDNAAVNVLVERNDAAAQALYGVIEYFYQDGRLSIASCTARADAELAQFAQPEKRLTFSRRDPKLRSGKTVDISLGPPANLSGTFKIQQVVIADFDVPGQLPWRTVTASNYLYSLEHLLRRVELGV